MVSNECKIAPIRFGRRSVTGRVNGFLCLDAAEKLGFKVGDKIAISCDGDSYRIYLDPKGHTLCLMRRSRGLHFSMPGWLIGLERCYAYDLDQSGVFKLRRRTT